MQRWSGRSAFGASEWDLGCAESAGWSRYVARLKKRVVLGETWRWSYVRVLGIGMAMEQVVGQVKVFSIHEY